MPTNAEAVAATLARSGVEVAFGLPGGEVVLLIEACRRVGIRFLLTGHEASAAFMAEVTGQLTGRPGVCIATLGPGAMNLSLGLANARLDRGPVLALTAQVPTAIAGHFPHQRLPLTDIYGAICKHSTIADGRGTEDLVEHCLRISMTPPHGPTHLALPSDIAGMEVRPGRVALPVLGNGSRRGSDELHQQSNLLAEIAAMLKEALRPLLIVGVGCLARDVTALRHFVDVTRMPFMVTPKAKGTLPEDAPTFLGVISGMAIDREVMETVDQADLLLGVGFDPVECDKAWYVERRIANLSRASTAEGAYRPIEAVGDVGDLMGDLTARVLPVSWPADLLAQARARIKPPAQAPNTGMSPLAAVRALREVLPRETVMTCDVGSHKYLVGQFWECYEPNTFFMSNGLSAMGYGLPAAIAAKMHFPERPVVTVVGDGGMLMMLHNLVFLRHYQVPVVVICFVDNSLSLIRLSQKRRGLDPYGVDFPTPDFAATAEAFGLKGVATASIDELKRVVAKAASERHAIVITVPVDAREYEELC